MIWRAIPGFPLYEASSDGAIRRIGSDRVMRSAVDSSTGYAKLTLYNDKGELKTVSVHRMVCSAFQGSPPEGAQACHRSGVKTENAATNLYWGTRHENAADRRVHELRKPKPIGRNTEAPITLRSIRAAFKARKINRDKALQLISAL